jgi:hypothetical protein
MGKDTDRLVQHVTRALKAHAQASERAGADTREVRARASEVHEALARYAEHLRTRIGHEGGLEWLAEADSSTNEDAAPRHLANNSGGALPGVLLQTNTVFRVRDLAAGVKALKFDEACTGGPPTDVDLVSQLYDQHGWHPMAEDWGWLDVVQDRADLTPTLIRLPSEG